MLWTILKFCYILTTLMVNSARRVETATKNVSFLCVLACSRFTVTRFGLPTARWTDMSKAIYPYFIEGGGIKNYGN